MADYANAEIAGVLDGLDEADTPENVLEILMGFARPLGFENYIIGQMENPARAPIRKIFVYSNWHSDLLNHRIEDRNMMDDPIVNYALQTSFPFSWKSAYEHASPEGRAIMDMAVAYGLVEGYMFPIRRPGRLLGGASLGGRKLKLGRSQLNQVQMAVTHAYCRLEELQAQRNGIPTLVLTDREKKVLSFAAAGKTSWETGQILGISEAGVKDALIRVRKKLGAVNKCHAIAIAIARNLILP